MAELRDYQVRAARTRRPMISWKTREPQNAERLVEIANLTPRRFLTPDWSNPILPGDPHWEKAPFEERITLHPRTPRPQNHNG